MPVQRPWFNNECQRVRHQYKRAKNLRHRINNAENYKFVHNASKAYKKCINKQFNLYKKDFIAKLRSLKHSDLESFAEHFKKLNIANTTDADSTFQIDPSKVSEHNFELNSAISEDEVLKCLNHLKLNKACSSGLILNEFLKSSKTKMLTVFTTFFNLVFNTGIIPDEWSQDMISPIYKNKGDKASPDNYRGITILSCFGKVFTAILNNRLNNYLESMNLLCEEQAGFRKKYGTTDHIFNLKCIIDLYLFRGKKLFCAFIDYKKAFDSVNRSFLWQKLLTHHVDGKMFKIIHSLYDNAKSCVRMGHAKSESFVSNVGVRQGENLSPILFSIFLNDLSEFISHAYNGLNEVSEMSKILLSNDEIEVLFKLYVLLYADDTVIFAESKEELQSALNAMYLYCKSWDLEVNPTKTKVTVFCNRKFEHNMTFIYNGQDLDIEDGFVYLGAFFSSNGRFINNNRRLAEQARKAMFSVLRKSRKLQLPVDLQIQLFDSMVVPIILYGSEITGFENSDILERLCTQFYRIILKVKKTTPNVMLYGELGRYPINILCKSRMVGFWQRIINGKHDKIAYRLYKILLSMHQRDFFHSKWLLCIKECLISSGLNDIWNSQDTAHVPQSIGKMVKLKLIENFKQAWRESVFNSAKCLNYRIFKTDLVFEQYFHLRPNDLAMAFCHFRCLNHKLPIELGRFWGVERDDRNCELCRVNRLGDEYHYLFECSYFDEQRRLCLPRGLPRHPNTVIFGKVMNNKDIQVLFKLSKCCKDILATF